MSAPDELLAALDPEQRQVAEALHGPVRVLAGAGTGKTRAITHRIAHGVATGGYQPTEVLAVTFTTRAAGEMRGRLRQLGASGVQARTFHSAALRQLRFFWPRAHGTELPTLTESKLGLIAGAARRCRIPGDQALLRDLASEIEWAKVSNVHPDGYARVASGRGRQVAGHDPETVAKVFSAYEDGKRSQGRMDMEDVLLFTAGMLADDERIAAQVRSQYKRFVVDEFQDVSPLQSALLDLWLGGRDELCVVGDPAQTIYSFAGARADYLRDFAHKFPRTTSVELVRNYRSTPQVVERANQLLAGTASQGVALRAQRPAGPDVGFASHPDEVAEATAVADAIHRLGAAGTPWSEMAVLFRINAQSEHHEEALGERGIPYVVRGAARFFDRPEVRQAVTLLRGTARSGQMGTARSGQIDTARSGQIDTARSGQMDTARSGQMGTDDGGQATGDLVETVRATLSGLGWTVEPPVTRGQVRDRWESWQALVDQATEFARGVGDLGAFVDELDRRASEQHAPVADGVTLATLHAAKGLEWDAVFVTGVQDGTIPFSYADTPAEVEEERRLLYVGMTRARAHLALSWSLARNPGGRQGRRPSPFLGGMLPAGQERPKPSARRRAVHCRECGQPLTGAAQKKLGRCADCPASYDEDLFERLREWRRDRAGEDQVPAFVVFTDATLQLIAEHKPVTEDALLAISGVGRTKLERYGAEVLGLLA